MRKKTIVASYKVYSTSFQRLSSWLSTQNIFQDKKEFKFVSASFLVAWLKLELACFEMEDKQNHFLWNNLVILAKFFIHNCKTARTDLSFQ